MADPTPHPKKVTVRWFIAGTTTILAGVVVGAVVGADGDRGWTYVAQPLLTAAIFTPSQTFLSV